MNWLLIYEITYLVVLVLICLRIIYDTQSTTNTSLPFIRHFCSVCGNGLLFLFWHQLPEQKNVQ